MMVATSIAILLHSLQRVRMRHSAHRILLWPGSHVGYSEPEDGHKIVNTMRVMPIPVSCCCHWCSVDFTLSGCTDKQAFR